MTDNPIVMIIFFSIFTLVGGMNLGRALRTVINQVRYHDQSLLQVLRASSDLFGGLLFILLPTVMTLVILPLWGTVIVLSVGLLVALILAVLQPKFRFMLMEFKEGPVSTIMWGGVLFLGGIVLYFVINSDDSTVLSALLFGGGLSLLGIGLMVKGLVEAFRTSRPDE